VLNANVSPEKVNGLMFFGDIGLFLVGKRLFNPYSRKVALLVLAL